MLMKNCRVNEKWLNFASDFNTILSCNRAGKKDSPD
jgi:hypothetical protein